MTINLVAEIHAAACTATHKCHQDQLADAGIPHTAIYGPHCLYGDFGIGRAKFHGNLWEPDPDGREVFIIGVCDHPQEPLTDLVAFQMTNPSRWWLRLGQGVILGQHNARLALFKEEPVFVDSSPLNWVRNDCQGCVVLDWTADLLLHLPGERILAADHATGTRLEKALRTHVHIPEDRVLGAQNEAA